MSFLMVFLRGGQGRARRAASTSRRATWSNETISRPAARARCARRPGRCASGRPRLPGRRGRACRRASAPPAGPRRARARPAGRRSRRGRPARSRARGAGTQAAHALAAAPQQRQDERQGVVSDDGDMGGLRQMGDRHHAIDQCRARRRRTPDWTAAHRPRRRCSWLMADPSKIRTKTGLGTVKFREG